MAKQETLKTILSKTNPYKKSMSVNWSVKAKVFGKIIVRGTNAYVSLPTCKKNNLQTNSMKHANTNSPTKHQQDKFGKTEIFRVPVWNLKKGISLETAIIIDLMPLQNLMRTW